MSIILNNPIFHDEAKARAHFEALRWPNGPVCPFCSATGETVARVARKARKPRKPPAPGKKHRPARDGLFYCNGCKKTFSVTVDSVMQDSHIPLHKWAAAFYVMSASKKGVSALQMSRMLGISYRPAWHLCHRVREAMKSNSEAGPIGGQNKVVESDETFIGGRAETTHKSKPIPKKHAVHALVEREGRISARHIASVTARNVREHLVTRADRRSHLMTDEAGVYIKVGEEFAGHSTVVHSQGEYVSMAGFKTTNTVESYFALLKRQIYGAHHAVSEAHLQRYVDELAFKWNHRIKLGFDDTARAAEAIKGAAGRRLTYRRPREAANDQAAR